MLTVANSLQMKLRQRNSWWWTLTHIRGMVWSRKNNLSEKPNWYLQQLLGYSLVKGYKPYTALGKLTKSKSCKWTQKFKYPTSSSAFSRDAAMSTRFNASSHCSACCNNAFRLPAPATGLWPESDWRMLLINSAQKSTTHLRKASKAKIYNKSKQNRIDNIENIKHFIETSKQHALKVKIQVARRLHSGRYWKFNEIKMLNLFCTLAAPYYLMEGVIKWQNKFKVINPYYMEKL